MKLGLGLLLVLVPLGAALAAAPAIRTLTSGQVIHGHFLQERHLAGVPAPIRSEGEFVVAVNRGLIWRTEKPFAITTVITAAGIAQSVGQTQTLRLSAEQQPFLARIYDMLSGALTGEWGTVESQFAMKRTETGDHWKVELRPKDAKGLSAVGIQSMSVEGSRFVEEVELRRGPMDYDHLTFSGQNLSSGPLSPDETQLLDKAGK